MTPSFCGVRLGIPRGCVYQCVALSWALLSGGMIGLSGGMIGSPPAFAQDAGSQTPQEVVLAVVNNENITLSDLILAREELSFVLRTLEDSTQRRDFALNYLIDRKLLAQEGRRENVEADADFALRQAYYTERVLRDAYWSRVLDSVVADSDLRGLYDERATAFKPQDEIQARHILVSEEAQARDVLDQIKEGADFSELANQISIDRSSAERGGTLGWFTKGQVVPAFGDAAFGLNVGGISDPVQTQFGWHIIESLDRRISTFPSFEEIRPLIVRELIQEKGSEVLERLRAKG